jgi:hypothetical protein
MTELAFRFGQDSRLVGLLTIPDGGAKGATGCLLFNAGVLHRVGPHRINVKLARALAARGVPSIRMDLSGLGDSMPPTGQATYRDQTLDDLRDGIALLERETGAQRVVSVGICSSAVDIFWLARADSRVVGIFMFDGYSFPTLKTHVLRRWRRLVRATPSSIPRAAWSSVAAIGRGFIRNATSGPSADSVTREEFASALEQIAARGTKVFIGYSGSILEHYNYHSQLEDAFRGARFLQSVQHAYLPHLDHTLTTLAAQREFIRLAVDWACDVAESTEPLRA